MRAQTKYQADFCLVCDFSGGGVNKFLRLALILAVFLRKFKC